MQREQVWSGELELGWECADSAMRAPVNSTRQSQTSQALRLRINQLLKANILSFAVLTVKFTGGLN